MPIRSLLEHTPHSRWIFLPAAAGLGILLIFSFFYTVHLERKSLSLLKDAKIAAATASDAKTELEKLKNQDQYKRNEALQKTIQEIERTYKDAIDTYERIQDIKVQKKKTDAYEKQFIQSLSYLSERNYSSAAAALLALNKQLEKEQSDNTPAVATSQKQLTDSNVSVNNSPPGSGFSVQRVRSDGGEFTVSIIAADLNTTKVIVDTASDSDCRDNCPVLSLADYVARNGAFAGINGSYFCPATYPSCAGKTNSFDTLLMNKNKTYFNSDNNVYSTVPVAVFGPGWARFISASSGWGRDTGVDAVIANQPLMVSGGNVVFGGDGDPKKGSRGPRSFIGNKGSTVYIGVVSSATVAEAAHVLKTLGLENALNLDSGGSTALWHEGYKAGPGRNIPNAILFVNR